MLRGIFTQYILDSTELIYSDDLIALGQETTNLLHYFFKKRTLDNSILNIEN